MVITIDGPAGSGKSSVAAGLAERLKISYLDTGAMYRAVTLAALEEKVSLDDPDALEKLLGQSRIELARKDAPDRVWLNHRDVSEAIRTPEVTNLAHKVAQPPQLRKLLVQKQRQIADKLGSLVTEGRDQGSVAFPEAQFKFYLDATAACRARRRFQELKKGGSNVSFEEILATQQQRDERDATRQTGPLKVPDDAVVIDTTDLSLEQVIETLYQHIKEHPCAGGI